MIKLHRTRETTDYQYISYHSSMKLEDQNYVTMIMYRQNHNLNIIIQFLVVVYTTILPRLTIVYINEYLEVKIYGK